MGDRHADVLLVGGGVASAACAVALREGGFEGSVVLAGREPDPPYSRPPASKGYLGGAVGRDEALYRPEGWYADHDVELLTRVSVMKMDPAARTAKLSDRSELSFGDALLATGANVRRLNVDGDDLEGLHYLRALRNADTIRADVEGASEVVLIGGSYIGCEVAATLTTMGKRCTVVMQEPVALSRGFGEQAGRHFQGVLEEHGVTFVGDATVERFAGAGERVEKVVLEGGRELAADAVVLGVGAMPDVMLARAAKLELGPLGGVLCDERLRTSADGVWAAGDMCEYRSVHHDAHVRIEHFEVAVEHGRTVAANLLGEDRPHQAVPYFWSDLADWCSLESVGFAPQGWDQEVVRGSFEEGAFTVWYLLGDRLVTALSVGRPADLDIARRLIAQRTDLSAAGDALPSPDGELP
ncbi:MAG: FAD-dependent oxidoreductase [Actinomycetota bacterium]|nr:FAD-dependent oxidoreductase [Actinomycetota bacterium]